MWCTRNLGRDRNTKSKSDTIWHVAKQPLLFQKLSDLFLLIFYFIWCRVPKKSGKKIGKKEWFLKVGGEGEADFELSDTPPPLRRFSFCLLGYGLSYRN